MWFEQKKEMLFDKCCIPADYQCLLGRASDSNWVSDCECLFESDQVFNFNYEKPESFGFKSETDDSYVLEYPLPGYVKDDIEIYLKDLILTISSGKSSRFGYYFDSKFKNEITVPAGTKEKDISAELKDGILKIMIKKVEKKELKKIEIK